MELTVEDLAIPVYPRRRGVAELETTFAQRSAASTDSSSPCIESRKVSTSGILSSSRSAVCAIKARWNSPPRISALRPVARVPHVHETGDQIERVPERRGAHRREAQRTVCRSMEAHTHRESPPSRPHPVQIAQRLEELTECDLGTSLEEMVRADIRAGQDLVA